MFALDLGLQSMVDEGIENVFDRHHTVAEHTRNGAEKNSASKCCRNAASLLTPSPRSVSPKVLTASFSYPKSWPTTTWSSAEAKENSPARLFRIGHMGWVEIDHIDEALEAAGSTLKEMTA